MTSRTAFILKLMLLLCFMAMTGTQVASGQQSVPPLVTGPAEYILGEDAYKQGDYQKAFPLISNAANSGHVMAQFLLGIMYLTGEGTPKDENKGFLWFSKAAEQGLKEAQFNLGVMYEEGQGGPQDYAKAAEWFSKAAEQGYAPAQSNLGTMYGQGIGVPQDHAKAAEWYSKAAEQGDSNAKAALAKLGTAEIIQKYETDAQTTVEDEDRRFGIISYYVPDDSYAYTTDKMYKVDVTPQVVVCWSANCSRNGSNPGADQISLKLLLSVSPWPIPPTGPFDVGNSYNGRLTVTAGQEKFLDGMEVNGHDADTLHLFSYFTSEQLMRAIASSQTVSMTVEFWSPSFPSKSIHFVLTPKDIRRFHSVMARYDLLIATHALGGLQKDHEDLPRLPPNLP